MDNLMTPAKRFVRNRYPDARSARMPDGRKWGIFSKTYRIGIGPCRRSAWESAERFVRREIDMIGGTG